MGLAGSSFTYMGYFWPCGIQGHLRSFGALSIFRNLGIMIRNRRKHFEWLWQLIGERQTYGY